MKDTTKTETDMRFERLMEGFQMIEDIYGSMSPEPNEIEAVKRNIEQGLRKQADEKNDV